MPRNMSVYHTQRQVIEKTKDVTRRLGWDFLKVGDLVWLVEKAQGLKKGEEIKKICMVRIVSTRWEKLNQITQEDVVREGFPKMSRDEFIDFFCKAMKVSPNVLVNRIEFEYVAKCPGWCESVFVKQSINGIESLCDSCHERWQEGMTKEGYEPPQGIFVFSENSDVIDYFPLDGAVGHTPSILIATLVSGSLKIHKEDTSE